MLVVDEVDEGDATDHGCLFRRVTFTSCAL